MHTFNTINVFEYYLWYPFAKKMRTARLLNYMSYNKAAAIKDLKQTIGWQEYGHKHGESLFTRLFQNYYLPTKFGYDKRLPHFSSLIVSGQMTRDQALVELKKPLYDPQELDRDITYLCKKLSISREQFGELMNVPPHQYTDFPNWDNYHRLLKRIQRIAEVVVGRPIAVYS